MRLNEIEYRPPPEEDSDEMQNPSELVELCLVISKDYRNIYNGIAENIKEQSAYKPGTVRTFASAVFIDLMDIVRDHTTRISQKPMPINMEDVVRVLQVASTAAVKVIGSIEYGKLSTERLEIVATQEYKHMQKELLAGDKAIDYIDKEWMKRVGAEKFH